MFHNNGKCPRRLGVTENVLKIAGNVDASVSISKIPQEIFCYFANKKYRPMFEQELN
jgi:hypothetical protein